MSGASLPIDLAVQPDFILGPLTVKPSTLEIVRAAEREVLEPRVMQVLVALHQSAPNVVSRDALIAQCWEGRVVGDDAINRAIGRLRRLAETDNAFAIETIPRIGYRLSAATIAANPQTTPTAPKPSRRTALIAGAGLGIIAAGAGAFYFLRPAPPTAPAVPPATTALIARGIMALKRSEPAGFAEAQGLFESAVAQAPQVADAWGGLGLSYAFLFHGAPASRAQAMRLRSEAAIDRAMALDPQNAYAWAAKGWLCPWRGAYLETEAAFRRGLSFHPHQENLLLGLAIRMGAVGRNRETASLVEQAVAANPLPDAATAWMRIATLFAAGRLAEADRAAAQNGALFPRSAAVWFNRVYLLMYTGRTDEALALIGDIDRRPTAVSDEDFDSTAAVARALASGAKADIDKATAAQMTLAQRGGGYAENAISLLSAMGRLDEAFACAQACYFGRGFAIAASRYSPEQGGFSTAANRRTSALFGPPTKAMRHDARFAALAAELGLAAYWQKSGIKPDYQIYPEPV